MELGSPTLPSCHPTAQVILDFRARVSAFYIGSAWGQKKKMLLFTFNSSEKMRSFLLSIHILDFFSQKVMNSEIELGVGMREGYL